MQKKFRRTRQTKIVATLGPATDSPEMLEKIFAAGVDVFRMNFSHGSHEDHAKRYDQIRALEQKYDHPTCVLADLQGPKLRIGTFENDEIKLQEGQKLRLDLDQTPGDETRVCLPHPEIFQAMSRGAELLLNDGRVSLTIDEYGPDYAITTVKNGRSLSNRKGVNVPGLMLPLSPLTEKDRKDLTYALDLGVDWVALSFVQRPEDIAEARRLIQGRAALMCKFEKPSAIRYMDELVELSDGIMVARGDLGVEMPPEDVPSIQKRLVSASRHAGKPVIVATQMLESMIDAPTPTRAEASDVATAVYDGTDAVMLSAENAAGSYPVEAVSIMNRIAMRVESDPSYETLMDAQHPDPQQTAADAITAAARQVSRTIKASAIVTYTTSGSTTYRAARERPKVPILCLTSKLETARRLTLSYGVHAVHTADVTNFKETVQKANKLAKADNIASPGDRLVITAGVPFGTPGSTNVLRIAWVE